ncbi:uncharacterized protein LOC142536691 [Primulina tabacum]|uniref:uncharacterized protein LOC142536691 n=1 Tax=Primulina tabacum TaxID=48773 RepID=UPI003F59F245
MLSHFSDETYHNADSKLRELPSVELSTLPLILKTVVESGIADQIHVAELILHDQDFFRKLMDLFRMCEDLENIDGLRMIFKIIRGIILLNSPQIFERIFSDELIMDIIGCFEYDPEVPHVQHRKFLKEHVVFKEVIPIKDPVVRSKIHQTYRVSYLKDVVWPRALDEAITVNFNSIIHSNNAIVVSLLKDDNTFIKELFSKLKSSTTEMETKKTLVNIDTDYRFSLYHMFKDLAVVLSNSKHKIVGSKAHFIKALTKIYYTCLEQHIQNSDRSYGSIKRKHFCKVTGFSVSNSHLYIPRFLEQSFSYLFESDNGASGKPVREKAPEGARMREEAPEGARMRKKAPEEAYLQGKALEGAQDQG